jgi:hypothetical protein
MLGMIYTLVFFVAGLLLLFIVAVPDERMMAALRRAPAPPQPRRRRGAPAPMAAAAPVAAAPAPVREPAPAMLPTPSPAMELPARESALMEDLEEAEQPVPVPVAAPAPPPAPKAPEVPVDIAAQQETVVEAPVDLPTARPELTGEEDVVYGNGPVTEDSIVEFIQNYPDSAVKFLYRKNLDNRPLPPMEEDIYQKWERRGMSRAKVRGYVLEIMGWDKLADDFPHNIWMRLRDRIYELKIELRARQSR